MSETNGGAAVSSQTAERFWAKVDKAGPLPKYAPFLGPCWIWTGFVTRQGYGRLKANQKGHRAHRFGYELLVGPIPEGLHLDHLCRVRPCVNPDHLEPVTNRENILRGASPNAVNARKTHCNRGHEFTPENTYFRPSRPTQRICLICKRADARTGGKEAR